MGNKNKKVTTIWRKIETRWPIPGYMQDEDFNTIKDKIEELLITKKVLSRTFSHFGFIVNSIDSSIEILKMFDRKSSGKFTKDWVEAYSLYVGRIIFNGKELEFIEPKGESFFNTFLKKKGEGLHHLAFQVDDIYDCFEKLKTKGVETIDNEPRSGSHGKVAFFMAGLFGNISIELFQEYK